MVVDACCSACVIKPWCVVVFSFMISCCCFYPNVVFAFSVNIHAKSLTMLSISNWFSLSGLLSPVSLSRISSTLLISKFWKYSSFLPSIQNLYFCVLLPFLFVLTLGFSDKQTSISNDTE